MPLCPTSHTSIQDASNFMEFLAGVLVPYAVCQLAFNIYKYEVYRGYNRRMPIWLRRIILAIGNISLAYAGWRIWSCGDWDSKIFPLAVWFFYLWVGNLESLIMTLALPGLGLLFAWQLLALVLNVFALVLFFEDDLFAGLVTVCHILFWVYELFCSGSILIPPKIYEDFKKHFTDNVNLVKKLRANTSRNQHYNVATSSPSNPPSADTTPVSSSTIPDNPQPDLDPTLYNADGSPKNPPKSQIGGRYNNVRFRDNVGQPVERPIGQPLQWIIPH